MHNKTLRLIVVIVLIAVAIVILELQKPDQSPVEGEDIARESGMVAELDAAARITRKEEKFEKAKEITTPDGFINSGTFELADFIGKKIILLDIWTYSCINCQRTLPYLNAWHEKYSDDGLLVVGLHTPEFDFEKEYDNVARAVEKFGVKYPVVLDNDYSTWRAYKNRYWPRKYLIDIDGFVVYDHIGEGAYDMTERKIVELLNERNDVLGMVEDVVLDMRAPQGAEEVDFGRVRTPELYLGYGRLEYLANLSSRDCFGAVCEYRADEAPAPNTFVLRGNWNIQNEYASFVGDGGGGGSLVVSFSANKVNLVAGSTQGVRAEIYLDGVKISSEQAGDDVQNGIVEFSTHDLYNVVDLKGEYGAHTLEIRFLNPGVDVFAFTFG